MAQFTAACVQLNTQGDIKANLEAVGALVREAWAQGAVFIGLPENALFMREPGKDLSLPKDTDNVIAQMIALATELRVWILVGSVHPPAGKGKSWNRSLLISADGKVVAQYDKIHLFNATLKGGEKYNESDRIKGGDVAVIAKTPWGKLGMTVCYDVRFPHLYRALAQAGAEFFTVPSAFTYTTGRAHWHSLLRARAIENGCYVIAPAQCGTHPGGRRTYGHSLIVDPWGRIIAEAPESETGIVLASIDTDIVADARRMLPSLKHDREFTVKKK